MKNKVYKELKRLYPNATGFGFYKTQYGTFYFAENNNSIEDITDTFKGVCLAFSCDNLFDEFNKNC